MPNTSTRWKIITSGPPSATSNETRVRAGLVASPADWEWSSARAHLGLTTTFGCLDRDLTGNKPAARRAGNPFGSEEFAEQVRQSRNQAAALLTPAAWIRQPGPPCYDFSGKSAL